METSSRRKFLTACLGGIGAAAACLTAYPLFRYLAPRQGGATRKKAAIPATEVPEGDAKFFEFDSRTAVLVRKKGGDLVALSAVCTHLGCIVQWQKEKEEFLCPCHAGRYSSDGAVLSGPPPKPLEKIPFVVSEGTILVG
jgi:cytochrome b6-f complex iron-sulfur subunit